MCCNKKNGVPQNRSVTFSLAKDIYTDRVQKTEYTSYSFLLSSVLITNKIVLPKAKINKISAVTTVRDSWVVVWGAKYVYLIKESKHVTKHIWNRHIKEVGKVV